MTLATINMNSSMIDDDDLRSLLSSKPGNTLILLEDVDCVFDQREAKSDRAKVTFSGLLNAIDGVAAGEGHILVMTTNHIEKLDPALIRAGRADVHVEIGEPDDDQKRRLFLRFFPDATETQIATFLATAAENRSMAGLQGLLMGYTP